MIIRFFSKHPILAILLHIGLGFMARFFPQGIAVYYVAFAGLAVLDILASRDRDQLAAFYGLYMTSFEILSRMSKVSLFWEFGKYSCIAIFGTGLLFTFKNRERPYLLWVYLLLLLPGVLITTVYGGVSEDRMLDLISQYLSGIITLFVAGWYFYQKKVTAEQLEKLIRVALLPAITLVTLLFLGKSLSEIDFVGGSNYAASGGFGPNQVSSILGWAIVLLFLGLLFGFSPFGNSIFDYLLLILLVFRGLLTFSRGGMIGAFGSIGLSMLALFFISKSYRRLVRTQFGRLTMGVLFLLLVAFITNDLTDNFLLYRYQGVSTSEVILGRSISESRYLTGRKEIMETELTAFAENPILGIGLGRGTIFRIGDSADERIASHTEFTRMLGEHGVPGLIALVCAFILLPFFHFRRLKSNKNRQWMLTFYGLSMFTMMHSGMRLALPCVAFGLAFIWFSENEELT
ncbi:MAG: O-antigen ligase family protein [Saprospiraceae bacterium]|nr:O-antigen ligase family protein [Lewinellaceae bacterium]